MVNKSILTLCIIQNGNKLLLGYKKRGFGVRKWNGFGGKLKPSETIKQAAIRETKEESGLDVKKIKKLGFLTFKFIETGKILEVHIFKAIDFSGQIKESEEMKPRWFSIDKIPFEKMWPDDIYWMPFFLNDHKFKGYFIFDKSDNIINFKVNKVKG